MKLAQEQIEELLAKAEDADAVPLQDGLTIPKEIQRREDRLAKLAEAKKVMEERAKERLLKEQAEYEAKLVAREEKEKATDRKPRGKKPQPPQEGPCSKDQYNFTDPESRIMKTGDGFQQCYNVQAAVDTSTMLIVGGFVSDAPNDKEQLEPIVQAISPAVGKPVNLLADSGYFSEKAVTGVEDNGQGPPSTPRPSATTIAAAWPTLKKKANRPSPIFPEPALPKSWPTDSKPHSEKPSTNCEKKPSNPSSES